MESDALVVSEHAYGPLAAHRLDLHMPDACSDVGPDGGPDGGPETPRPVVVYVHGGGWMTGDKSWLGEQPGLRRLADLLLGRGWAIAAINYRLSGEAPFPAGADDVAAAIAWLSEAAPGLGLDPARIVLLGDSAGAHLSLLTAMRDPHARANVRGVVSYYGVPDLAVAVRERKRRVAEGSEIRGFYLEHMAHPPTPEGRFLGVEPDAPEAAEVAEAASAVAAAGEGAPPVLLLAGRYDAVAGTEGAEQLAARLRAAGVDGRCVLVEAGHGDDLYFTDPALTRELLDFLAAHAPSA
ncbi:hypothetical protein GCM10022215_10120 [Nocardioides fonticola]|uniref:BD-FAE-like domain-containing protein n=1 Tax=Nocardioides fonticola TaxID=450363 RepID=A0ABP7XF69_9ACTN